MSSAVFTIGETRWPPSWADASLFFFFQFANWISGRELTWLSQGNDEALTSLGCQNIRPQERWPWEFSGQGHPLPAPRNSKPWRSKGPGVGGDRQPGRTHPGPRLAFCTRCPSEWAQQCLRQIFTLYAYTLTPYPEQAFKIGNWLFQRITRKVSERN